VSNLLPSETHYPSLADFLRHGGKMEIGECRELGSFARLYMERDTFNVVKTNYRDLAEVLHEMDSKAKGYIEANW
jgi:hypothetical protein